MISLNQSIFENLTQEIDKDNVELFPNPANNILNIQFQNTLNSYYSYLRITEIGVKEIYKTEIKNGFL